jgi:hypothetical protein
MPRFETTSLQNGAMGVELPDPVEGQSMGIVKR